MKKTNKKASCMWGTNDDQKYFEIGNSQNKLIPGVYSIEFHPELFFVKEPGFNTEELVFFDDSEAQKVINDIREFWDLENQFKKYRMTYKRGILLYGPPGGGKSSVIKLVIKNVIDNGGIAILFDESYRFEKGLKLFRKIQPDTPVVVIMEELEEILNNEGEHNILNLLDGVNELHKICFVATTNYPENLDNRIKNRPSRFDKRYEIKLPSDNVRKQYLSFLFNEDLNNYNLNKWVADTENLSIAHIKELFIQVVLYGHDYSESLEVIRKMSDEISSEDDDEQDEPVAVSNGSNGRRLIKINDSIDN